MTKPQKFPVGIQNFESLIHDGYAYADKTAIMYKLIDEGRYYFLSRPRRFGKSLMLSTIRAYFEGKADLFKGLAVEKLHEGEWVQRPVFHIDLNIAKTGCVEDLCAHLDNKLAKYELQYHLQPRGKLADRFSNLIEAAHEQSTHRVAILIDEYDKPMNENINNPELQEEFRKELRAFYGVMKSEDGHIRFGMLTGVSKFGKLNIFSGLNNITDISMLRPYATICGLTQDELRQYFGQGVEQMAEANAMTTEECYAELARYYDGYHFCAGSPGMYNPYSIVNALQYQQFSNVWRDTGKPTVLVKLLQETGFDIAKLDGCTATGEQLGSIETMHEDPLPIMFQSGYLTIKGYDREFDTYTLGIPNQEVGRSFASLALHTYANKELTPFDLQQFIREVRQGKPHDFMERLQALTAGTSYEVVGEMEKYSHNVLYLFFLLMGFYTEVEQHTSDGRMDMVVKTPNYIYIFEFKMDEPPAVALAQIEEKQYALPYQADPRKLYKIGVQISTKNRRIEEFDIV